MKHHRPFHTFPLSPHGRNVLFLFVVLLPLFFWLEAGTFTLFGASEYAARFPSALCGYLCAILIYLLTPQALRKKDRVSRHPGDRDELPVQQIFPAGGSISP